MTAPMILEQCAELEDYDIVSGQWSYDTSAPRFDPARARCALQHLVTNPHAYLQKNWSSEIGALTTAAISARWYTSYGNHTQTSSLLGFSSGRKPVLTVGVDEATYAFVLCKVALDGTITPIAYSQYAVNYMYGVTRIMLWVKNYGASATVEVWICQGVDSILWQKAITYTGDVRVSGVTDFDGLWQTDMNTATNQPGGCWMSEIITANVPTMRLRLRTFPATGAGSVNTMDTGDADDIKPLVPDDARYAGSNDNGDKILCAVQDPTEGLDENVLSYKIVGTASREEGQGPQHARLLWKTHGVIDAGATEDLAPGDRPIQRLMRVNPQTSDPITLDEIKDGEIGAEVIT